jgi:hypothetical protein
MLSQDRECKLLFNLREDENNKKKNGEFSRMSTFQKVQLIGSPRVGQKAFGNPPKAFTEPKKGTLKNKSIKKLHQILIFLCVAP